MSELPRRRLTLPAFPQTHRMETGQLLSNTYTAGFEIGICAFVFRLCVAALLGSERKPGRAIIHLY